MQLQFHSVYLGTRIKGRSGSLHCPVSLQDQSMHLGEKVQRRLNWMGTLRGEDNWGGAYILGVIKTHV